MGKRSHGVFAVSALPRRHGHVSRRLFALRRELEQAVTERHGKISLTHAAAISTALTHEQRALLYARWLQREGDTMPIADRMACVAGQSAAREARDRAIQRLGIDDRQDGRQTHDDWDWDRGCPRSQVTPQNASESVTEPSAPGEMDVASDNL